MKLSLGEIAVMIGGVVRGNPDLRISGAAPFERAGQEDITLAGSPVYWNAASQTRAGALIVPAGVSCDHENCIEAADPQVAFTRLINLFADRHPPTPGIDPQSVIGLNFSCGAAVTIFPGVVIADNVILGDRVVLYPGVYLGDGVTIGSDVEIHAHVSILWGCIIGSRVTIQAGTVVGSDGFGYTRDGDRYLKIAHTGIVRIDDDVEIGACNTIDRGKFDRTWIKSGVKTDNLIHIAHNVTVGENTIIVAQAAVAGSVTIGRNVILAGQAGISGHLTIGDHAIIGPQAGIAKSVAPGDVISGTPGMPHKLWLKTSSLITRLPDLNRKVKEMEKRLAELESRLGKNGSDDH
ncbi:MAG: UDP-3-O-(3-hydroxymyristoyl)glucosamine N-acyltransferase [Thermodesulfobacteriota bacterium]